MRTSAWARYAGAGRIALCPAPRGTPRGYKLAPHPLYLRKPLAAREIRPRLLDLDPWATWRELHALVYPAIPVLMGEALEPVATYRRIVADWLAEASGRAIRELNPTTYRPGRAHPSTWRPVCTRPTSLPLLAM